jgi:hypothetical protein
MDNEDKLAWCEKYGDKTESEFCVNRLFELDITGYLNPEKNVTNMFMICFLYLKQTLKQ